MGVPYLPPSPEEISAVLSGEDLGSSGSPIGDIFAETIKTSGSIQSGNSSIYAGRLSERTLFLGSRTAIEGGTGIYGVVKADTAAKRTYMYYGGTEGSSAICGSSNPTGSASVRAHNSSHATYPDQVTIHGDGGAIVAAFSPTQSSFASPLNLALPDAADIGLGIELAASHTGNAIEVNSNGGSGGDLFKIAADGKLTVAGNVTTDGNITLKPTTGNAVSWGTGNYIGMNTSDNTAYMVAKPGYGFKFVVNNADTALLIDSSSNSTFSGAVLESIASITSADSPYTVATGIRHILADASSGAITINLPAVSGENKRQITVVKTDST